MKQYTRLKKIAGGGPIGPIDPDNPKTWMLPQLGNVPKDIYAPPPQDDTPAPERMQGILQPGTGARMPGANNDYDNWNYTPSQKTAFNAQVNPPAKGTGYKGFVSLASSLAPYASNIVNSFRTPPKPAVPVLNPQVSLSTINLDNERNRVSREINSTNASADRSVDGNTSAAIKLYNQGQKLDKFSDISQQESNTNAGIRNQQAQLNAGVTAENNRKLDDYNTSNVERKIAQQREQSMNIANAGEKYMNIQNENEKRKVDLQKTQVMSTMFNHSGVLSRQRAQWKKMGLPDPVGEDYKDLPEEKKFGGPLKMKRFAALRPLSPLKQIPQQTQV